jgi:flagellar hook-associated protein 3 FlgL
VAVELTGIQSQMVSLANTSYQGQYLFAGTANQQPFVLDASSSSGVRYDGNQGVNQVAIGTGYSVQINQPGSTIFNGGGADVFQSLQDLITALNSNGNISGAVDGVSAAYNYITEQRVFYGNAQNQASAQQNFLAEEKLNLSQQANSVGGADAATAATQLTTDETAINATLGAIAKMPQNSLFDYLR